MLAQHFWCRVKLSCSRTTFALYLFRWCCVRSVPVGDDDDEASIERNMAAVSPIPKIVTTPIKEDFSREDEDSRDEWGKSDSEVQILKKRRPETVTVVSRS